MAAKKLTDQHKKNLTRKAVPTLALLVIVVIAGVAGYKLYDNSVNEKEKNLPTPAPENNIKQGPRGGSIEIVPIDQLPKNQQPKLPGTG